jgi:hypothetical protein
MDITVNITEEKILECAELLYKQLEWIEDFFSVRVRLIQQAFLTSVNLNAIPSCVIFGCTNDDVYCDEREKKSGNEEEEGDGEEVDDYEFENNVVRAEAGRNSSPLRERVFLAQVNSAIVECMCVWLAGGVGGVCIYLFC